MVEPPSIIWINSIEFFHRFFHIEFFHLFPCQFFGFHFEVLAYFIIYILYLHEYSLEFLELLNLPIKSGSLEFWNLIEFCGSSDIFLDFRFGGFKGFLLFSETKLEVGAEICKDNNKIFCNYVTIIYKKLFSLISSYYF